MLLSSFMTGIRGVPGLQVRYANPQTLKQALRRALSVQEAERQEKFSESFYASFDKNVRLKSQSPGRTYPGDEKPRQAANTRAVIRTRDQRYKTSCSVVGQ
jgi:hypothetical protein